MSLMNVVRIAKILALLAFVLPWAAVSCNNVDVATASGIELIQGKMTANPDANRQLSQQMGTAFGTSPGSLEGPGGFGGVTDSGTTAVPDLGMNYVGIAAAAVILVGLLLSFVGTAKSAARNVIVTSLLGLALCFGTVWWWKEQVKGQSGRDGGGVNSAESPFGGAGGMGGMGAMGANMLDQMLQERFGYWIAIGALVVAAGAGGLGMVAGGAGAIRQDGAPPPVA